MHVHDKDMEGRSFNQAFHCQHKHLNNAATHLFETAQKFHRKKPEEGVDPGTREELMRAQREIQAVEGHSGEILTKMDDSAPRKAKEAVRDIGDTARELRQKVEETGVPFKADVRPSPNADDTVEKVMEEVEGLQRKVDRFATEFEQEQMGAECERCTEDLMDALDGVADGLKKELKSDGTLQEGEDAMVGSPTSAQNPGENLITPQQLGEPQMVDSQLTNLALGAFGAKTLEEAAEAVEQNVSALQNLPLGPLNFSDAVGLSVGLGVPVLQLGTDLMSGLGADEQLALNTAAATLLANELGDLAGGLASGTAGGQARTASVRSRTTKEPSTPDTGAQTSSPSAVNVGQGGQEGTEPTGNIVVG